LVVDYRDTILGLLDTLTADNLATAVDIAALPEKVRGFGHVKEKAVTEYQREQAKLLARNAAPAVSRAA
jgi:indolepyruvate ferredoxin oxidoreductase